MGIQINGNTDNITATDGGLSITSLEINQTGISTFQAGVNVSGGQLDVGSNIKIGTAGVVTATTLDINGDIDVDGHTNLDNVSIAGVSTFSGVVKIPTVAGTNTNADLNVLFQTAAGVIDGGSQLTYNPSQDALKINGNFINVNTFRGGGDLGTLTCANHSSSTAVAVSNTVDITTVDNAADAFTLKQGSNEYITVDTTNSSELITLGNTTTNPKTIILGGNVGIGTDNPNHELTVYGDEPNFRLTHTGSTNKFNALYTNVDGTGVEWNSYQDGTGTRRPFIFKQYTTEVLRIASNGDVGVGKNNPDVTLHVGGGAVTSPQIKLHRTSTYDNAWKFFQSHYDGNSYGTLFIQPTLATTPNVEITNSSGAMAMRVDSDTGVISVKSGGGIDFSAGGNAGGMTSELLDDYEEGTFTPSYNAGGGVTFSHSQQYGYYTKVGDTVFFSLYIQGYASTITGGNANNGVAIQGLPFTIKNLTRYNPAFTIGRTYKWDVNSDQKVYSYGDSNSTNARIIVEVDDTTGSLLVAAQLNANTTELFLNGHYKV